MRRVSKALEAQGAVSSGTLFRVGADYADKASYAEGRQLSGSSRGLRWKRSSMSVTRGGASTCGTEVVYRIGVNRLSVLVRDLDPATSRYVEKAQFTPARDEAPSSLYRDQGQAGHPFSRCAWPKV